MLINENAYKNIRAIVTTRPGNFYHDWEFLNPSYLSSENECFVCFWMMVSKKTVCSPRCKSAYNYDYLTDIDNEVFVARLREEMQQFEYLINALISGLNRAEV